MTVGLCTGQDALAQSGNALAQSREDAVTAEAQSY